MGICKSSLSRRQSLMKQKVNNPSITPNITHIPQKQFIQKEIRDINSSYTKYYDDLGEPLSVGAYYSIKKAKDRTTSQEMIIKYINKNEIRNHHFGLSNIEEEYIDKLEEHLVIQAKMMIFLNNKGTNKNTVMLHEYFVTKNEIAMVMEKCDTDLHDYFCKRSNFSFAEIRDLLIQLNNSFRLMNQNKIIHGDLKLPNILLKFYGNSIIYKLTDYGISKEFLQLTENKFRAINGTAKYSAPEVLKYRNYDVKSDLWSLGVIIYILAFRVDPYEGETNTEVFDKINNQGQKFLIRTKNPEFDHLIRSLLKFNYDERITWDEYFRHPFLQNASNTIWEYYTKVKERGKGPYYKIFEVLNSRNERRAIKVIDLRIIRKALSHGKYRQPNDDELKEYIDDFMTEIDNMEMLQGIDKSNKNALIFYEYFQTENEFCIVEELCDCDLRYFLRQKKELKKNLSYRKIYKILSQLNNSFRILVSKNLAHKDLSLDHILLKNDQYNGEIYKLTGLELSKKVDRLLGVLEVLPNFIYKAPEVLKNESLSGDFVFHQKADIWSLGVIVYTLYFSEFPFEGNRPDEILNNISKNYAIIKNNVNQIQDSPLLKDLLNKMLEVNSYKRIGWREYFDHPFFSFMA